MRRRVGRAAHGLALAARAAIDDSATDSTNTVIHELRLLMYMLYNTHNVLRKNMLCNQAAKHGGRQGRAHLLVAGH